MNSMLIRLGLTALIIAGLAGCGGTSIGVTGVNSSSSGSSGTIVAGATDVRTLSTADFQALRPVVTVQSVTIPTPASGVAGTPVVKYTVVDQNGHPVVGLGGQYVKAAANDTNVTQGLPYNFDISFTLAKLIPAANGEPSRWVNYLVTKLAATSTPASAVVANGGVAWTGTYPTTDSNGTIVDHGDGTYQYTFLHDVTQIQNVVKSLPSTYTVGSSTYNTVDLDIANLNYDATATTRLGVLLTGSQPGTGTAVPGGVQPSNGPNPVPLVYTVSEAFDFVPNGSPVTNTREIVTAGSCDGCHDNVTQKRGLGHISTASATNGIPPGAYVGRNNPRLCVACHTDQAKFGFPVVTSTTNADGSPAYSGAYYRVDETTVPAKNGAAFIYPRMIHQTHMGNQLVKTGYNLNNHCTGDTLATNAAQCFNLVGLPQDQRNCTKCHDGSATKSDGSNNLNQTKDGDNWKNVPSQVACGSCHDGINFITGTGITLTDRDTDLAAKAAVGTHASGHGGGAQADNSQCTTCHTAGGIAIVHETPYDSLNSVGTQTSVDTLKYSISKVTVNSSGQPVITFQIMVNGKAVTSFAAATTVTNSSTGAVVVDPNFAPIPANPELAGASNLSFYAAYAVPQDGVAAPADFNVSASASLANLLVASGSPKAGSITGPDANGNFTATLTGDMVGQPVTATCKQLTGTSAITGNCVNPSPIHIPTNAVMVTGAIIGGFVETGLTTYPYTAAVNGVGNTGGLGVTGVIAKQVATGYTARRVIVSAANCNNCHDRLGTDPAFHNISGTLAGAGYRNDPTACNFCHNANRADNGFVVDSSTWMHGIHGASKRTVAFANNDGDFSTVLYPGQLKDCSQCHLPNTVNFGAGDSGQGGNYYGGTLTANLLWSTAASGKIATPAPATFVVTNPQLSKTTNKTLNTSPYVTVGTNYGNVFTFANASAVLASVTNDAGVASSAVVVTNALGQSIPADGATLVNSPISSACSACHTDSTAWDHMRTNGGVLYGVRSTSLTPNINSAGVLVSPEACLACHGQGAIMDAAVVHQTQ